MPYKKINGEYTEQEKLEIEILLHNNQIQKAKEIFKDKLSPQALIIINNMQSIIDKLIKENNNLKKIN